MEALSQLDITNPDHVSVITRDQRVTVSVIKDGTSVTLGFPITQISQAFDTSPIPPAGQPVPVIKAVSTQRNSSVKAESSIGTSLKQTTGTTKKASRPWLLKAHGVNLKLNDDKVREIKLMLSDEALVSKFGSRKEAYIKLGQRYGVSNWTISNIDKEVSWIHVKV